MERVLSGTRLPSYFNAIVRESFWQLGIHDATVANYIAAMLTKFARSDNLYRMRTAAGEKIDSIVLMLMERGEAPEQASALIQERSFRQYLGDYTLFMSGIFRRHIEKKGALEYYLDEGSRSYKTVSELDVSLYRAGFTLFQELSEKFEYYSGALDYTRKAYFAVEPSTDPFKGLTGQVEGWIKVNLSRN